MIQTETTKTKHEITKAIPQPPLVEVAPKSNTGRRQSKQRKLIDNFGKGKQLDSRTSTLQAIDYSTTCCSRLTC